MHFKRKGGEQVNQNTSWPEHFTNVTDMGSSIPCLKKAQKLLIAAGIHGISCKRMETEASECLFVVTYNCIEDKGAIFMALCLNLNYETVLCRI